MTYGAERRNEILNQLLLQQGILQNKQSIDLPSEVREQERILVDQRDTTVVQGINSALHNSLEHACSFRGGGEDDGDMKMPAEQGSDTKKRKVESNEKDSTGGSDKDDSSSDDSSSEEEVEDVMSFLRRHLIKKKDLPPMDQSSEKNDHRSKLSEGLEEIVKLIMDKATEMRNNGDYDGAHFCHLDFNGTDINHGGLFLIGNFAPGGGEFEHHKYGILSTCEKVRGIIESINGTPTNCSIHQFFAALAQIMSIEYGVDVDVAMKICLEISYWVDILPITLPAKAADAVNGKAEDSEAEDSEGDDNEEDDNEEEDEDDSDSEGDESSEDDGDDSNSDDSEADGLEEDDSSASSAAAASLTLYQQARKKTDALSKQYIKGLIKKRRPKVIVTLGAEPFKFINEMTVEDLCGAKIFQHSPNIHPTRMLKFGANRQEGAFLYECISLSLAHLIGVPTPRLPMKEYRAKARSLFINHDMTSEKGCYIFKGTDMLTNVVLFYARTYTNMRTLIRENGGSVPSTFPKFRDFQDNHIRENLGLRMEKIWFEDHDYSKDFGVQDKTAMASWMARSDILRTKELRAEEQARRITVNQGGAIDEMNNIFG